MMNRTKMNAAPPPDLCPDLGFEVPVSRIDSELRKLWERDEARTNASLINLVVYSEKPGSLCENSAIIRDLTREHACRAILVEVNAAAPQPGLRAWITAHCHLAHGMKSVCCEQIAFHLTGRVTGRFRNTVFAHLSSDLPLVFWWQGELSEILSERLVAVMDRLIIDSALWVQPSASFRRIAETSRTNRDLILQDHEWSRTWQFRLGVAGIFDDPVAARALPEISQVEIHHHPAHRNAALQLLAWLAVQAAWEDREAGARHFVFKSADGRAIHAALQEKPDAPPLSSLVLRAGECTARLSQGSGATHIARSFEAPGYQVASPGPADPSAPDQLLAQQLARGGKNSLFRKILPRFQRLLDDSSSA